MISQNINRIMPKIIGDSHDFYMRRYFESSEKRVIGEERVVFPVNKAGYMVPCTLMIKVLPTLDDGIRVVGFLKDIENGAALHKDLEIDNEDNVKILIKTKEIDLLHNVSWR